MVLNFVMLANRLKDFVKFSTSQSDIKAMHRILMLWKWMQSIMGQRPVSQHRETLSNPSQTFTIEVLYLLEETSQFYTCQKRQTNKLSTISCYYSLIQIIIGEIYYSKLIKQYFMLSFIKCFEFHYRFVYVCGICL